MEKITVRADPVTCSVSGYFPSATAPPRNLRGDEECYLLTWLAAPSSPFLHF